MSEPQLGNKLLQIYSETPIGSLLILIFSILFTLFNLNLNVGVSFLDAINPIKLLFFTLSHGSWWHAVIAILVFPLASVKFEREHGTLALLFFFLAFNVILGQLFIWISYILKILSLFTWNMESIGISGLDISFMVFITIEAMNLDSSINSIPPIDNTVPKFMYPVSFMLILEVILWDFLCTRHLIGIILGYFYSQKVFHGITPSPYTFGNIESIPFLQPVVRSKMYVPHPGAISLDSETQGQKRESSFLDQVQTFVGNRNSQYVSIDEGREAENELLQTKDELWDDLEENQQSWEEEVTQNVK